MDGGPTSSPRKKFHKRTMMLTPSSGAKLPDATKTTAASRTPPACSSLTNISDGSSDNNRNHDSQKLPVDDVMNFDASWNTTLAAISAIAAPASTTLLPCSDILGAPIPCQNKASTIGLASQCDRPGRQIVLVESSPPTRRRTVSVDDYIECDTTTACSMQFVEAARTEPVQAPSLVPLPTRRRQAVDTATCTPPHLLSRHEHTTWRGLDAMMDVTNGDSQRISVDDFIDCDTTPSEANLGDDLWTGDNDNARRNILHTEQADLINEETGVDDGDDNAGKWDNGIPRVIFVMSDEADGEVCRDQASGGLDSTKRAHGTLLFSLLQTEDPIIDDDHPECYEQALVGM